MASGVARRLQARDRRPVAILDRHGRPRWHAIWNGNPRIARPAEVAAGLDVQRYVDGPGRRPYIERVTPERFVFRRDWRASRGEIYLSAEERAFGARARGCLVIEPHLKARASSNKRWPLRYWQDLVAARSDLDWVQLGPLGTERLQGVRLIETSSFRLACAVLACARAAVLPEGGLHHAAAALRVPAVVIFGGYVSPCVTGYPDHANIYRPHTIDSGSCGMRRPCQGCADSMARIAVDEVLERLEGKL